MKLTIAHFSRQQEFEADRIGIKVIAKAGFDPFAASRFLSDLGKWSALRASLIGIGANDKPDMMATHPSTPERIAEAVAQARQLSLRQQLVQPALRRCPVQGQPIRDHCELRDRRRRCNRSESRSSDRQN